MTPYTYAYIGYALWAQAMASLFESLVAESVERLMEPARG